MNAFRNFRIGAKLGLGFGVALTCLCLIGALAIFQVHRVYQGTVEIADNWLPSVQTLGDARSAANAVRRGTMGALVATNADEKAMQVAKRRDGLAKLGDRLERYQSMVSSAEEATLLQDFKAAWSAYLEVDNRINALAEAGDASFAEARELTSTESSRRFATAIEIIEREVELNRKGASDAAADAADHYEKTLVLTSGLIFIALVLSVTIAVLITRAITVPLRRSVEIAESVAEGDLTSAIEDGTDDETGQLLRALRRMNTRLSELVGRVREGSDGIATASAQIAAGNTDLSQRTEEQAASLEETAASMEELTATVRQNAGNAQQGNELAAGASRTALRGGEVVGRVVKTMGEISTQSAKVAEIISVIEGIAFQTNILALNAAVEAARAGEQGRGFAVVAAEVRNLAQRSATAAKEIRQLIGESVEKVETGSTLVDEAGRTMEEVVGAVRQVAQLMAEISSASVEQQTGIEQVNIAVSQMDEVTQQNAALVEQASAAAQAMAQQSGSLRDPVSIFRTDMAVSSAG